MNKRIIIILLSFVFIFENISYAQNNLRDEFLKASKRKYEAYKKEQKEAYERFSKEQNEEYANFIEESWLLYEDFKKQSSPFTEPKFNEAPIAPNTEKLDWSSLAEAKEKAWNFVVKIFSDETKDDKASSDENVKEELSSDTTAIGVKLLSDTTKVNEELSSDIVKEDKYFLSDNNVDKELLLDNKVDTIKLDSLVKESSWVEVDFYGEKLYFNVSDSLKLKLNGLSESSVACYFRTISNFAVESSEVWNEILVVSEKFGLNEWGKFLLLQKIAESLFQDINERVLFCFYMLRNEGFYKVKVARGSVSNNLVLMMALDNTKEVYEYGYFVFVEQDVKMKYYLVYGAGREETRIYSYSLNKQDLHLNQLSLDFDSVLSIGACDRVRELRVDKLNKTIDLPFNSRNIAFLNDVPQTAFPIYFASALPLESQEVLEANFGNLRNEYSVVDAVNILLDFVQNSFAYKTDNDQFGYEKYFYPEESLGYPYCDCEDRSALFGWLVRTYVGLPVIGLQYPGHLATAVAFGDDVVIDGTGFVYGGKKYYVCDPTYRNAKAGMAMPEFKSVMPTVIKLKKL